MCTQILIDANLKTGKRGIKITDRDMTGRSPLRRRRPALDCTAIDGGGGRGD
jgi:hypothetical protein